MIGKAGLIRAWSRLRLLGAAGAVTVVVLASAISPTPGRASDLACGNDRLSLTRPSAFRLLSDTLTAGKPVRLLAIGSSSTQGAGASGPDHAYPAQLERELRSAWRGRRIDVLNAGIGGETADQTLARLERLMAEPAKPALVLWQVGTNDALRGGDEGQFRSLLERGIALVRAAGSDLVIVDQQFFPKIGDLRQYERYVALVTTVAGEHSVPVFPRYKLMKLWAERDPALLGRMLSADSFHMGDLGYHCLADALGRSVTEGVDRTMRTRGIVGEPLSAPAAALAEIRG
ncbi:SGNH/GDSL hydrolase family protein [Enterovirga sp. CN4-39]|uniref:SGNH/GDSL hydrolase family protein n=1 Tax=Enterovirga sp. CN4-39 TaxID=3400910 RepID=UPI003C0E0188